MHMSFTIRVVRIYWCGFADAYINSYGSGYVFNVDSQHHLFCIGLPHPKLKIKLINVFKRDLCDSTRAHLLVFSTHISKALTDRKSSLLINTICFCAFTLENYFRLNCARFLWERTKSRGNVVSDVQIVYCLQVYYVEKSTRCDSTHSYGRAGYCLSDMHGLVLSAKLNLFEIWGQPCWRRRDELSWC